MIGWETRAYGYIHGHSEDAHDLMVDWRVRRPFRLFDLLLWGVTGETILESVEISTEEQLVAPLPYLPVFGHSLALSEVRSWCRVPEVGLFGNLPVAGKISTGRPTRWSTAWVGEGIRLRVVGPVSTVILIGESPEEGRFD